MTDHSDSKTLWHFSRTRCALFAADRVGAWARLAAPFLALAVINLSGCAGLPDKADSPVAPGRLAPVVHAQRWSPATASTIAQRKLVIAVPDRTVTPADRAGLPDLWERIRAGFMLPDLDSPDVERFAHLFASSGWLERLAPRARLYLYLLVAEAEKRNLPVELALLPIIESGLNPQAHSPADAVGLCQFIPATGKRFGLYQSALADRRKDLACMHGMFDYLESNAALFGGDWHLALAAYNWGEGSVARAVERNGKAGLATDYLSLRMPNETRGYVPQLLAIKRLIADPQRYGISLPEIENRPIIACDIAISQDMDVDKAARLAGISAAQFRSLNPGVRKGIIPRATHPTICLPYQSALRFVANASEHKGALATWTTHTVNSRTTLSSLAKRYQTTPDAIRSINEIPAGMRFKAGATMLVPRTRTDADITLKVAMNAITSIEPDVPDMRRITIKAKRKDSLNSIAKHHRVTLDALRHWNRDVREPLQAGQKIVLHLPVEPKRAVHSRSKRADVAIRREQRS